MRSDDGVRADCLDLDVPGVDLRHLTDPGLGPLGPGHAALMLLAVAVVHALEAGDRGLHAVRQGLVSEIQVREQGIAAIRRHLAGDQHRALGGLRRVHLVRMPAPAVIEGIVLALEDLDDVRIPLHRLVEGMAVDLAPALGEGDVLIRRDVLAADGDHLVFQPGAM